MTIKVVSPCVSNCCLDDEDVCLGCHRTLDEILRWSAASNEQKIEIINQAKQRGFNKPSI